MSGGSQSTFYIFCDNSHNLWEFFYFIAQQLLNTLSSEEDVDMHGTIAVFISKHSYLSSSLWNLYTEPLLQNHMMRFHMKPFEVPNTNQDIEILKVIFRTFCIKPVEPTCVLSYVQSSVRLIYWRKYLTNLQLHNIMLAITLQKASSNQAGVYINTNHKLWKPILT